MLAPAPGRHTIAQKHEFGRFSRTAANLRQYRLLPKSLATRSWYRRGYLAILTACLAPLNLSSWNGRAKGIPSEVFHGKRSISKTQAKKLAEFFHFSAELFI